jgi:hypothetical protein
MSSAQWLHGDEGDEKTNAIQRGCGCACLILGLFLSLFIMLWERAQRTK